MIFITVEFRFSLDYALPVIVILITCWMFFTRPCYLLIFIFSVYYIIVCFGYAHAPSLILHTHWEFSDSLHLHIKVYDCYIWLIMYLERSLRITRARVLFAWTFNLSIFSCLLSFLLIFLWFSITRTLYLFYWFICKIILSCVEYVTLQWFLMPSLLIDIACSGHFRFNVYTWGIFLAYIRRRLSSRLRFNVFWEGRDKNSSVTLFL